MNTTSRLLPSCTLALFALPVLAQERDPRLPVRPPNVLFILIDDQNDWVGPLGGHPDVKTPFLDELARRGTTFTNAHASATACNPSRAALLSGLRPTTSGVYHNRSRWGLALGEHEMFPDFLKARKFLTVAYGKVNEHAVGPDWDAQHAPRGARDRDDLERVAGLSWQRLETSERKTADYRTARQVEEFVKNDQGVPFLMACGFRGPHVPWTAPGQYFDMYPEPTLPEVRAEDLDDIPAAGLALRLAEHHPALLEAEAWGQAVQAYLASVSFTDAMIGRVLAALDGGANAGKTIIVVTSDHGFHLGEKEHWRKFTLWEESTRVPLIIVAPGVTEPGTRCDRPVELVSLYATLAELCGFDGPAGLDGPSLVPLLRDPSADWDTPALTTQGRGNHAVRTERWRYIRYADGSEELYDHENDPHEWTNLAGDVRFEATRAELAGFLPREEAEQVPLSQRGRRKR